MNSGGIFWVVGQHHVELFPVVFGWLQPVTLDIGPWLFALTPFLPLFTSIWFTYQLRSYIVDIGVVVMSSIFSPPSPSPDCVVMAPPASSNALIVEAVLVMLPWLAYQGAAAEDKLEDAREGLNRACQLLSVHGMWAWIPRMICILTGCKIALQS